MQDRISEHPGRVRLIPVPGEENVFDMQWADDPEVEGTPLNKENLLKDTTAQELGLTSAATPNDAFLALANRKGESTFQKLITGRLV